MKTSSFFSEQELTSMRQNFQSSMRMFDTEKALKKKKLPKRAHFALDCKGRQHHPSLARFFWSASLLWHDILFDLVILDVLANFKIDYFFWVHLKQFHVSIISVFHSNTSSKASSGIPVYLLAFYSISSSIEANYVRQELFQYKETLAWNNYSKPRNYLLSLVHLLFAKVSPFWLIFSNSSLHCVSPW